LVALGVVRRAGGGAPQEDEPNVLIETTSDEGVVSAPLICIVKPTCLTIAVLPDHKFGIDMSKPRLRLIHCSNSIRPGAKYREHSRSFRPLVIHGGVRARSMGGRSWEAALELVDLGLVISHANYLAFLEASIAFLGVHHWPDPEKTS